jgi:hypothetical protein
MIWSLHSSASISISINFLRQSQSHALSIPPNKNNQGALFHFLSPTPTTGQTKWPTSFWPVTKLFPCANLSTFCKILTQTVELKVISPYFVCNVLGIEPRPQFHFSNSNCHGSLVPDQNFWIPLIITILAWKREMGMEILNPCLVLSTDQPKFIHIFTFDPNSLCTAKLPKGVFKSCSSPARNSTYCIWLILEVQLVRLKMSQSEKPGVTIQAPEKAPRPKPYSKKPSKSSSQLRFSQGGTLKSSKATPEQGSQTYKHPHGAYSTPGGREDMEQELALRHAHTVNVEKSADHTKKCAGASETSGLRYMYKCYGFFRMRAMHTYMPYAYPACKYLVSCMPYSSRAEIACK